MTNPESTDVALQPLSRNERHSTPQRAKRNANLHFTPKAVKDRHQSVHRKTIELCPANAGEISGGDTIRSCVGPKTCSRETGQTGNDEPCKQGTDCLIHEAMRPFRIRFPQLWVVVELLGGSSISQGIRSLVTSIPRARRQSRSRVLWSLSVAVRVVASWWMARINGYRRAVTSPL